MIPPAVPPRVAPCPGFQIQAPQSHSSVLIIVVMWGCATVLGFGFLGWSPQSCVSCNYLQFGSELCAGFTSV